MNYDLYHAGLTDPTRKACRWTDPLCHLVQLPLKELKMPRTKSSFFERTSDLPE
jgi:hypothetical protein